MIKKCANCDRDKHHHARGFCYTCYKKINWKPKEGECKRCQRKINLHARGLCAGCYNYTYHLDKNKAYHHRKANDLDVKTYKKVTKECAICSFDLVVDLCHIDRNRQNNEKGNLVGLCPNHHRLLKNARFRPQVLQELVKRGFDMPVKKIKKIEKETYRSDEKRSLIEFT